MRKVVSGLRDAPYKLMAMATFAILNIRDAAAQDSVGGVANNVSNSLDQLGRLLLGGAFLGGVGFCAAGLMKLKAASDDGGQRTKYSEGLWRIGVGAALVALPTVAVVGRGTLFGSSTGQSLGVSSGVTFRAN